MNEYRHEIGFWSEIRPTHTSALPLEPRVTKLKTAQSSIVKTLKMSTIFTYKVIP